MHQCRLARISHQTHKPEAPARVKRPPSLAGASGLCQHTVAISPSGEKCGLVARRCKDETQGKVDKFGGEIFFGIIGKIHKFLPD